MPKDSKDQHFRDRRLLPTLSLCPLECVFFCMAIFLLLILLPWGISFKYTERPEKKVDGEKERTMKYGL